jgi:ABC-type multidrug transport system fused ATPase/permease subunit
MDEPTARLDLASEALVAEAAGRLLDGRTALLVAHRPALVAIADRVVQLGAAPCLGEARERIRPSTLVTGPAEVP